MCVLFSVLSEEEAYKLLQALPVIPAYIFEHQSIKIWLVVCCMSQVCVLWLHIETTEMKPYDKLVLPLPF